MKRGFEAVMPSYRQEHVEKEPSTIEWKAVFDRIAEFCNSLPFAGKLALTPLTLDALRTRQPEHQAIKLVEAAGMIGVMTIGHLYQVGIVGAGNLERHAAQFEQSSSPEYLLACAFDVTYIAANCAAAYAQLHLAGRLKSYFERHTAKRFPRLEAWGIHEGEVDYRKVAETLLKAKLDGRDDDIEAFLAILPDDTRQKVLVGLREVAEMSKVELSEESVEQTINALQDRVGNTSRYKAIFNVVKGAHAQFKGKPYDMKEALLALAVTVGGQVMASASQFI